MKGRREAKQERKLEDKVKKMTSRKVVDLTQQKNHDSDSGYDSWTGEKEATQSPVKQPSVGSPAAKARHVTFDKRKADLAEDFLSFDDVNENKFLIKNLALTLT